MSNTWSINIDTWIFSDGNYATFHVGEVRQFALEFNLGNFALSSSRLISAEQMDRAQYHVNAQVSYIDEKMWVLDFGVKAYCERNLSSTFTGQAGEEQKFLSKLNVGQHVQGDLFLSIDHFLYMESLCSEDGVPPLIYTWKVTGINKCAAPWLPPNERVVRHIDKTQNTWFSVESTSEKIDRFTGFNEIQCTRQDQEPTSDGAPLANWDGSGTGSQ